MARRHGLMHHSAVLSLTALLLLLTPALTAPAHLTARSRRLTPLRPPRPPAARLDNPELFVEFGSPRASITDSATTAAAAAAPPQQLAANVVPTQADQLSTFNFDVFGDPTGAFTSAIEHSFSLLGLAWVSAVPVNVFIEFRTIGNNANVLAAASPTNFVLVDQNSELYPGATAEAATGNDFNDPADYDLLVNINSLVDWYTGTDARPPRSQTDFVSVFLHEVIHGLGFVGLLQANNNQAAFERNEPSRFDRFLADGDGCSILAFQEDPASLYTAVTNGFLYFADDSGALVARLFAPSVFSAGSSVYHLSNDLDGTEDDLQTPSLPPGFANHNIGNVTSIILSIITDPTHVGAPVCRNQRNPLDAPERPENEGFFDREILGLQAWLFLVIVGAGGLVLLLGTFVVSLALRRT